MPRGVLEGRIDAGAVSFVTRTAETGGSGTREVTHRYLGRLSDGEFRFVMQTESASSVHAPVEFSVRRLTVLASLENR